MWQIFEHRSVQRRIRKLPKDILKRYEKWKDIVQLSGPKGLGLIRGFNDESLRGEWRGHRSSRLSQQYRVIYSVEKEAFFVVVVEVSPHDYRKNEMRDFRPSKRYVDVSTGESVRILRELQELSQNDLAEFSGIPQSTISAIENDRVRLGVERAKVLGRALKCHPAVLVFPGWDVGIESAA